MLFEAEAFRMSWLLIDWGTDLVAYEISHIIHRTREDMP